MWWDFVLLYKSTSRHTLILCSCALFSFAAMCRTHCPFLWWVPQVKSYLISSFKHKFIIILIRKSKTTSIIPIYPRFLFITKSSASGFWIRYLKRQWRCFYSCNDISDSTVHGFITHTARGHEPNLPKRRLDDVSDDCDHGVASKWVWSVD